jgi:hypothetical protein
MQKYFYIYRIYWVSTLKRVVLGLVSMYPNLLPLASRKCRKMILDDNRGKWWREFGEGGD